MDVSHPGAHVGEQLAGILRKLLAHLLEERNENPPLILRAAEVAGDEAVSVARERENITSAQVVDARTEVCA